MPSSVTTCAIILLNGILVTELKTLKRQSEKTFTGKTVLVPALIFREVILFQHLAYIPINSLVRHRNITIIVLFIEFVEVKNTTTSLA